MRKNTYLIKRYDRTFYSFQMRFCIPTDLQTHFKRKQFKVSLKSVNYKDSKRLSLYLNDFIKEIYKDLRMSKKKLTLEEVKSILKIEVKKSVLHIQHIETGTGTTENQVLQSLQHILKEETQFKRSLEDDMKKVENKVDGEMSKILKSNGFKIDKKSLEFKTLRKRVIELKLLRYKYKKDFITGGVLNTNINGSSLNGFIEECNRTFNLDILDEKVEEKPTPVIENFSPEPIEPYIVKSNDEVVEEEETFLISKLIKEYIEETERQKDLRHKTIVEYRSVLEMMVEVIGDFPIKELSQKHGRLISNVLQKLPPRRKTDGRYNQKSIEQIIQMDVKNPMDTRTINKLIQRCSSWLNWVIRKGYYDGKNIFHGKSIPSNKGKNVITRQPFNEEQLKLIFGKNYLNRSLNSVSHCRYVFYWVGILGLFHGTRLQETTQLHIKDIYPLDKIWVIDINENTNDKKLKTKNSNRIIPLHQTLIDLGFLEYLKIIEQKGKERVFHELTLGRDGYSKNPSKFFNDYLRELGIKSPTKKYDFHSLRHTCNNSLIQKDVIEEHRNDYLGWGQSGMSKKVYGKPFEPSILQKRCSKNISYKVKWNDLKVDWKQILG